jgi:divalent metal cation (Fe/Co/Zn/Cd) transporter
VASVQRLATAQRDVVDCHEVLLTASRGRLSVVAHVRGSPDLPLERIHDASTDIEKALRELYPEVGAVLIHFEPAPDTQP